MFNLCLLAIFVSVCQCEEDTLPVLLEYLHQNNKGNIGDLIDKYENEAKDLIEQQRYDENGPEVNKPELVNVENKDVAPPEVRNHQVKIQLDDQNNQNVQNHIETQNQEAVKTNPAIENVKIIDLLGNNHKTDSNIMQDPVYYDPNSYNQNVFNPNAYNPNLLRTNNQVVQNPVDYQNQGNFENQVNVNDKRSDPVPNYVTGGANGYQDPTYYANNANNAYNPYYAEAPNFNAAPTNGMYETNLVNQQYGQYSPGYQYSNPMPMPLDVSKNRKKNNFFDSLMDIIDTIVKGPTHFQHDIPTSTKQTVKETNKPKKTFSLNNVRKVEKFKNVPMKKRSPCKVQSKKDSFENIGKAVNVPMLDTDKVPMLNLNISLQDANQKSIVLQIPINIYLSKNPYVIDDSQGQWSVIDAYPDEDKPSLRLGANTWVSSAQEAKDNAMAKEFREKIKKSRQSNVKAELRRVLPKNDDFEPGIHINV